MNGKTIFLLSSVGFLILIVFAGLLISALLWLCAPWVRLRALHLILYQFGAWTRFYNTRDSGDFLRMFKPLKLVSFVIPGSQLLWYRNKPWVWCRYWSMKVIRQLLSLGILNNASNLMAYILLVHHTWILGFGQKMGLTSLTHAATLFLRRDSNRTLECNAILYLDVIIPLWAHKVRVLPQRPIS